MSQQIEPAVAPLERLSVVIPACNEEEAIGAALEHLHLQLRLHRIPHEIIVVVDDGSTDGTWGILTQLEGKIPEVVALRCEGPTGFGRAVTAGFEIMSGDAVVVMMADESDDPRDVVRYWETLNTGYDCVFGSRFIAGGGVIDYPRFKLLLNRIANWFIRRLFRIQLNDTTNAFKAYRREVIAGCQPILSPHFNLTVELPLKAIVRGYSFAVIPISWRNRRSGVAKLQLREMGSRYLFIVMYVLLEKYFSRGYYHRDSRPVREADTEDTEGTGTG